MPENEKQTIRAEAITEFAERLKKYYTALKGRTSTNMVCYTIDELAKEVLRGEEQ
jgi:hypothetical protein